MKNLSKLFALVLLILGSSFGAKSQFYQVYGYTTLDANEKEVVLWNTFIPLSDQTYSFFGETANRQGLFAHSLEVEYGITRNMTVALYADFEQPKGHNLKHVRTKAVAIYYSFFEKNYLPVDLALYGEYKLPRKGYKDYEELEIKLILEKDISAHRIILNPTFEKKISGEDANEGVEFVMNASYTYLQNLRFQPKIEYYAKMGELIDMPGFDDQKHYVFPSFDLFFGKYMKLRWHAGIGFGLTNPADNIIVKSILSWEFF